VFPSPIILSSSASTSSIMQNLPETTPGATDVPLPGVQLNYRFRQFTYRTDGSTDLSLGTSWFMTLVSKNAPTRSTGLPANFIIVQIDPQSGEAKIYQP
jgi:hypothetical protein